MMTSGTIHVGRAAIDANVGFGLMITPRIRLKALSLPTGSGVGMAAGVVTSDIEILLSARSIRCWI
jgi:hypothetical protein